MIEKSYRINDIVNYLQNKYGAGNILIKDHWDADRRATGLTDRTGQYLAYVSTISNKDDQFYVALENPPVDSNFPYTPAGDFENINLTELEDLLVKHLRLSG